MRRYFEPLLLACAGVMPALAAAPAFPVRILPGGSFVVHAAETREQVKATSSRADYCDQPTSALSRFEVHRTTLQPGAKPHEAHRHEREEMMILLEGQLEVLIEETRTRIGAGSAFLVVSNDLHGVTNVGDRPASYLVINFYTPQGARIPPSATPAIPSTIWQWSELPVKGEPPTERRDFVNGPTRTLPKFEMSAVTLHPDQPRWSGKLADEQFLVVKAGEMEAVVGERTVHLRRGDLLVVAAGQEANWRQVGNLPVTYYRVRFTTPSVEPKVALDR